MTIPRRIEDFDADKVSMRATGLSGTATSGTSTNIDYQLAANRLLTGLSLLVWNAEQGDTATLQIVHPTYGVIDEFGSGWRIDNTSVYQRLPAVSYPANLPQGLIIRVRYTATSSGVDRLLGINLELHEPKV